MKTYESKGELTIFIDSKGVTQPSRLFVCNKVELKANHIFFWSGKALVLKVWLKGQFDRIDDALKSVDMMVLESD